MFLELHDIGIPYTETLQSVSEVLVGSVITLGRDEIAKIDGINVTAWMKIGTVEQTLHECQCEYFYLMYYAGGVVVSGKHFPYTLL
jgi:hypothetical protein